MTAAGGRGNDLFVAASGTLVAGDQINGNGDTDTLGLIGAGLFNLAAPATLANIAFITAQEGQSAYVAGGNSFAAQNQVVDLRNGLNAIVNVSPDSTFNPNNPHPAVITIVGANNSDTINLASGNDIVTVGSPAETVNLGSGNDTIMVTASTIGAMIGNGTGQNTLNPSGGGTMAMGSNISDIAKVLLTPASTPYVFTANGIAGLVVDDASTTADTLQAGGPHQTLTGGASGKLILSQQITTTPGASYNLRFALLDEAGYFFDTFTVSFGGFTATITGDQAAGGYASELFSIPSADVTGTSTTLSFQLMNSLGLDWNLDDVSLTPANMAGVPGPVAGAGLPGIIFASVGLLLWLRRHRKPGLSAAHWNTR